MACIVTILMIFATIGTGIIFTIWDFKFHKGIAFEPVELSWEDIGHMSPYATTPPIYNKVKYYDTYFHFIWNINPQ